MTTTATTATTAATTLRRRLSLAAAAVCLPLSIGVAIAQAPTQAEISAPATSASVTTDAPNSSSAKLLSIRDIYDRVDAAGYRQVREIDLDHGRYEVKALNPQGQSVKLYVNAHSGAIEQVRNRSND